MELNTYYRVWQDIDPREIYIVYTLVQVDSIFQESYRCRLSSDCGYDYGTVIITPSYWDNITKLSSLEIELL
jgi:hypothetical protein